MSLPLRTSSAPYEILMSSSTSFNARTFSFFSIHCTVHGLLGVRLALELALKTDHPMYRIPDRNYLNDRRKSGLASGVFHAALARTRDA